MSWKESNILAWVLGHLILLLTTPDVLEQGWKAPILPPVSQWVLPAPPLCSREEGAFKHRRGPRLQLHTNTHRENASWRGKALPEAWTEFQTLRVAETWAGRGTVAGLGPATSREQVWALRGLGVAGTAAKGLV